MDKEEENRLDWLVEEYDGIRQIIKENYPELNDKDEIDKLTRHIQQQLYLYEISDHLNLNSLNFT